MKMRIPDLRAINHIGDPCQCIVYEGGSGELIIEVYFINERNKTASPA